MQILLIEALINLYIYIQHTVFGKDTYYWHELK